MNEGDAWKPTYRVPATGAACWAKPDRSRSALEIRLDPDLEVRDIEHDGEWMHVECSNGWTTWVDRQGFVALGSATQPEPTTPPARNAQFRATHTVPAAGLDAYESHDASQPAVAKLDPNLAVQVDERWGDWAHIVCS